jgi:hypothetical protein
MPTIELTKAELKEARDCLFVERENVGEMLRRYPKGDRDHASYAKAARLLDSILYKIAEAKHAND